MAINSNKNSGEAVQPHNPHKRLHNIIFIVAAILLTGQVLEGSFLIPFVCVYFGYPTISLTEVCSEMGKMAYKDEDFKCAFPYPLFASVPEPWTQKNHDKVSPPTTPPQEHFERLGFREVLEVRKNRLERQAAEARAAEQASAAEHPDKVSLITTKSGSESLADAESGGAQ